ncbi:hypothetical protein ACLIA0_06340 [Bacillaceae bacterium W0354]
MLNPEEFIEMFGTKETKKQIRYATIDPNYTSGNPKLIFGGEDEVTVKEYIYLSSYTPKPNDRVMLLGNVIIGALTGSSETGDQYAPINHNHDDRYYTESEIDSKLSGKSDVGHGHKKLDRHAQYEIDYDTPPTDIPQPTFRYDFIQGATGHGTYRTLLTISGYTRGAIQISFPYGHYGNTDTIYWRFHNWSNDTWSNWMAFQNA